VGRRTRYDARVHATAPVASACPLCGQPNRCAMEVERETGVKQPACWCTQAAFPPELLARVPAEAQRRACICPACAGSAAPA
jgi:hypothetical protein